jgi:oligoribonuclease (3'-5' exoribonuclease)
MGDSEPRFLYCWFDTEYTTLELERARLLEVALIVTNVDLVPVRPVDNPVPKELLRLDGFSAVLTAPPETEISEHVLTNYRPLLERCAREGRAETEIDEYLMRYLDAVVPAAREDASVTERPVLAGNSIYSDYFLAKRYLPKFASRLHYRHFDVTSLKLEWQQYHRQAKFQKLGHAENIKSYYRGADPIVGDKHDAYYDVQASIAELAYYRSRLTLRES